MGAILTEMHENALRKMKPFSGSSGEATSTKSPNTDDANMVM